MNDYGSLDYVFKHSGGWIENQSAYLAMVSAHSQYWYNSDVARFVLIEVGRVPGLEGRLPSLMANKKPKSIEKKGNNLEKVQLEALKK